MTDARTTPETAELATIVREAVALICRTPVEAVVLNTRPIDVIGWDSFGRLQVVLELERRIGKELPLERAIAANSVSELVDLLGQPAS